MGRARSHWVRFAIAGAVVLAMAAPAAAQQKRVDLELVIAIDTSSSVDDTELDLQVGGIALAFRDPRVIAAIEAVGGVAGGVVQWARPSFQSLAVPWTPAFDRATGQPPLSGPV